MGRVTQAFSEQGQQDISSTLKDGNRRSDNTKRGQIDR